MPAIVDLQFFESVADLRRWFERNHASATEVWIGFHRKGTGRPGPEYLTAVDEALCFGWIDGVRKKVDDTRYANRFSPRKPASNWSLVNIGRVAVLEKEGRMTDAGRVAFAARLTSRTGVYAFEQESEPEFTRAEAKQFRANAKAWKYFSTTLAPSYRRIAIWWVVSAKKTETRERRLAALIVASGQGKRLR